MFDFGKPKMSKATKKYLKKRKKTKEKRVSYVSKFLTDAPEKVQTEWKEASQHYLDNIPVFPLRFKKTRNYLNKFIIKNISKKEHKKLFIHFVTMQEDLD